jgi:hypothetical protein
MLNLFGVGAVNGSILCDIFLSINGGNTLNPSTIDGNIIITAGQGGSISITGAISIAGNLTVIGDIILGVLEGVIIGKYLPN